MIIAHTPVALNQLREEIKKNSRKTEEAEREREREQENTKTDSVQAAP